MADRLDLQQVLEDILGSRNVYYNPPPSLQMKYDAIRYTDKVNWDAFANNKRYAKMNCYEVILITKKRRQELVDKMLELPYCSYDRTYKADNLDHDVFTIYF